MLDQLRSAFADVPVDELERETDRITAEIRAGWGPAVAQETAARPLGQPKDDAEMVAHIDAGSQRQLPGIPSTQTPQDFYAELSKGPKVRRILTELAE